MPAASDETYLALIRNALEVCREYKPKFGHGRRSGYSVEEFQELYRQDPFYTWFGLDSPLVYAAHRAAGGMTSLYRQIGIGVERLFRQVLQDTLGLQPEQSNWSYQVPTSTGRKRTLSLDGRIAPAEVTVPKRRRVVKDWLAKAATHVQLPKDKATQLGGAVFEVRQGYKSKDSKRQNADIANAANAYANNYLPSVVVLSTQIDSDISERYVRAQWLLLTGTLNGTPLDSTYQFCRQILDYDLAAFFERTSDTIKSDVEGIIKGLLE